MIQLPEWLVAFCAALGIDAVGIGLFDPDGTGAPNGIGTAIDPNG